MLQYNNWEDIPDDLVTRADLKRLGMEIIDGKEPDVIYYSNDLGTDIELFDIGRAVLKTKKVGKPLDMTKDNVVLAINRIEVAIQTYENAAIRIDNNPKCHGNKVYGKMTRGNLKKYIELRNAACLTKKIKRVDSSKIKLIDAEATLWAYITHLPILDFGL